MKRTWYNWQVGDCLYRVEQWRNAPKDVAPFTVYMLNSQNGNGPGGFVGYFMTKQDAEDAIQKSSTTKVLKFNKSNGMILP